MASPLPSASMSEIGEIIADMGDSNIMENSEAPAEESPTYHTKRFRSVLVILLEKELFKISLLVPVLCSLSVHWMVE